MKLLENWKEILGGAWSVYLLVISSLFSSLAVFVGLVDAEAMGLDPVLFAGLAAIASALGVVARIVQQITIREVLEKFRRDTSGAIGRKALVTVATVSIASAAAFTAKWEGLRTSAYVDPVGVWTVCYGETKGVQPGDKYSAAKCQEMLERELKLYGTALGECLAVEMPAGAAVAFLDWSYNIGTGAACRSTLVRKANAGDLFGACDELLRWDKARINGRLQRLRGLTNRRRDEHSRCVQSLIAAGYRRADAS